MSQVRQFCTFTLDSQTFGVDVQTVQEVIRYQKLTRVPLAPRAISGLINLRGQIVAALDLRERLDLPPRPADQLPMNVVVRGTDGAVSLLVDEIGDVLEVDDDRFERTVDTLQGPARRLIQGTYKLDGRLLLALDTDRVVNLTEPT